MFIQDDGSTLSPDTSPERPALDPREEWEAIYSLYDRALGASETAVLSLHEFVQRNRLLDQRKRDLAEWHRKHAQPMEAYSPAMLAECIKHKLTVIEMVQKGIAGQYPTVTPESAYRQAYKIAVGLRELDPSLPPLPTHQKDPMIGLYVILDWCVSPRSRLGKASTIRLLLLLLAFVSTNAVLALLAFKYAAGTNWFQKLTSASWWFGICIAVFLLLLPLAAGRKLVHFFSWWKGDKS